MTESVSAICFPREDPHFARTVHALVDPDPEPVLAAVQALLRDTYPLAVVRSRHPLACFDGQQVWYVFRDGSVLASDEGSTP